MSKHVAPGRVKRAHIVGAGKFFIDWGNGDGDDSVKLRLLVTVRTHSDKLRQAFREFVRRYGLGVETDDRGKLVPVQGHGEPTASGHYATATFDCFATAFALNELLWQPFVVRYQFAMTATVGQVACGTGPEKVRLRPPSVRPDSVSYRVIRPKKSKKLISRVVTTPRTKPATYADPASLARYDERGHVETENEVIVRMMKQYPSARFAD